MKPSDPGITWIDEKPLGLAERLYIPLFVQGLTTTSRHLVSKKNTVNYPEQRPDIGNPLIYRGVHRLNRDENDRVKCVACFLCATACPAHCIDIVATESPWEDREKYPESFQLHEPPWYKISHRPAQRFIQDFLLINSQVLIMFRLAVCRPSN